MHHKWVKYLNPAHDDDRRDYICEICNIKSIINLQCNTYYLYDLYSFNDVDYTNLTCEEIIIKRIIE
jgi:hypothetical protein